MTVYSGWSDVPRQKRSQRRRLQSDAFDAHDVRPHGEDGRKTPQEKLDSSTGKTRPQLQVKPYFTKPYITLPNLTLPNLT